MRVNWKIKTDKRISLFIIIIIHVERVICFRERISLKTGRVSSGFRAGRVPARLPSCDQSFSPSEKLEKTPSFLLVNENSFLPVSKSYQFLKRMKKQNFEKV